MLYQAGMLCLQEAHPTRAARGKHGLTRLFFKVMKKLGAFFHDGHVCCEVGIKDIIEAQFAHGGNHATHCGFFL